MESILPYIAIALVVLLVAAVVVLRQRKRSMAIRSQADPYVEALTLLVDGDENAAFEKLQQAVRDSRAPMDAYLRLGRLLRKRGETNRALQVHQSLTVKKNLTRSESQRLHLELAEDYEALGRIDRAIAVLEDATRHFKKAGPELFEALVRYYGKSGDSEKVYEALKELKRFGAVDERKIALILATGAEKNIEKGNEKGAKKLLQRALKHDPQCAFALLLSADLAASEGDSGSAVEIWRQVTVLSPELTGRALESIEKVLFEKGRFGEMERIYGTILEKRPGDREVNLSLARFLLKQGRVDEATQSLREFLSWHPGTPEAALLLLSIHARGRDLAAIEEMAEELASRSKPVKTFRCEKCSFQSDLMRWHCPICNSFYSFVPGNEA